jgi:hypothetical protein
MVVSPHDPRTLERDHRHRRRSAIDECGEAPTIQKVAERAATLSAEWVTEELAEEAANP